MSGLLGTGSFNGLNWGPTTSFHISSISGVDDLTPVRASDALRAMDHGAFQGRDLLDVRTINLDLALIGVSSPDYYNLVQQAMNAFVTTDTELPLLLFNSTRQVNARVRRRVSPYDAGMTDRIGTMQVQFVASDPRIYDATLQAPVTGLPTAVGGLGFNFGFSMGFGSSGVGGTVSAINSGSFPSRPVLTILGPCDNPRVGSDTSGKTLKFALSLASTDVLTVDLDTKSVVLNGSASRDNSVTSDSVWWELLPGTNSIRFNADAYTVGAQLTVTFRSAWV